MKSYDICKRVTNKTENEYTHELNIFIEVLKFLIKYEEK